MRVIFNTALLALGLGALTTTPAVAAVFASAQLSNFNIVLTDLNLGDGLSPMLSVLSDNNFSRLISAVVFEGVASQGGEPRGLRPFGALSANLAVPTLATFSSIVGGAMATPWTGALLHVEGQLLNLPGNGELAPYRYFTAGATAVEGVAGGPFFLLGPYSAITMTATAQVTVSKDFAAPVGSFMGEAVVAVASLELGRPSSENGMTVSERVDLIEAGQVLTRTAMVTAAIYNNSADTLPLTLRAFVSIDGNSRIAAVPEPETWAMWAVGLVAVGALSRRRMPSFISAQMRRS